MNRFEYVERATATIASNRRAAAVRRELLSHIDLACADLMAAGTPAEEAEREALAHLGDPILVADEYQTPRRWWGAVPPVYWLALPAALVSLWASVDLRLAVIWYIAAAVVALAAVPGTTLRGRFAEAWAVLRERRDLVRAGAIAGAAAALATFGQPPYLWATALSLVEIVVPALVVLHRTWQRAMDGREIDFLPASAAVAAGFACAALPLFVVGQWRLPWWQWQGALQPVLTAGMVWIPGLTLAVMGAYGLAGRLGSWLEHAGREAAAPDRAEREA